MSRIRSPIARRVGRLFVLAVLAGLIGLVPARQVVRAFDGTVTSFPLPTPDAFPTGITTGPDGNIWFTEDNASQIGRITPEGQITEFPTLTPGSGAAFITVGPDGNLWFTEETARQIGRITPEGQITEFPVGVPDAFGITTGPDGNLWATFQGGIVRITPQGVVTLFFVPSFLNNPDNIPFSITTSPDGNLWFTETGAPEIGRITPQGDVTEFPLTLGARTIFITTGPDGNLWFTEASGAGSLIGRMTPQGPRDAQRAKLKQKVGMGLPFTPHQNGGRDKRQ